MIGVLDRNIDPRERMSLNYTIRWTAQAWRKDVSDQTIRNCFIKSTIIGRSDQIEGQDQREGQDALPPKEEIMYVNHLIKLSSNHNVHTSSVGNHIW